MPIKTFTLLLALGLSGNVWGAEYEKLFTIASADVVSNSGYSKYEKTVDERGWIITFGGNNKSVGTNSGNRSKCTLSSYSKYAVSPITTSDVAAAFVSTVSISDVSKISYTFNGGSSQTSTNVYLIYSSDGNTFSQVSLTSGTQGATISSGTAYEFAKCSGYFGLLFKATNSSGNWRIDDVNITFYKAKAVTTSHTVTFDGNGHGNPASPSLTESSAGAGVTLPSCTPTSDGYVFAGWATTQAKANAGTVDAGAANATYKPSADITLYAVYKYNVKWSVNGTIKETVAYTHGSNLALPTITPVTSDCDGSKVFVGWTTGQISTPTDTKPTMFTTASGTVTAPVTYYAVFATGSGSPEQTMVNFTGNTSSDLTALDYVTATGLGSDYAASNAPYQVKLDNTGDYILLSLPSVPTSISITVKMIGGTSTSSITLQECETSNGSFTNVETMSISGAQNDVIEWTSSKTFSKKYIKLYFTKGSNVGLGGLQAKSGGTTYSGYVTTCTEAGKTAITYNKNTTDDVTGSLPAMVEQTNNTAYTVSTATLSRTGYTFVGWNTSSTATTALTTIPAAQITGTPIVLYAIWSINNYNLTFDKNDNDAGGSMSPQSFTFNETNALSSNTFTAPAHKHFTGWATTPSGSVAYTNGANYKMSTEGATLYAVWAYNQTTITLDKQNGSSSSIVTATYGSAMPSAGAVPTKTGYDFNGYYTGQNGTGTQYYNSTNASVRNWDKDDASLTLYAYWTPKTITITLAANGHSDANGSFTIVYGTKAATAFTAVIPHTGYTVRGYYTTTTGGGAIVINPDGTLGNAMNNWIDADGNWMKATNETLYACYTPDKHTVTWMVSGNPWIGKGGSTKADYDSRVANVPTTVPTTSDCDFMKVFVGWTATEIDGTTNTPPSDLFTDAAGAPIIKGDATYYAVFALPDESATEYAKGTLDDLQTGKKVLLVHSGYAVSSASSTEDYLDAVSVSVVNSKITTSNASIIWNVTKNNTQYKFDQGSNKRLNVNTTGLYANTTDGSFVISTKNSSYELKDVSVTAYIDFMSYSIAFSNYSYSHNDNCIDFYLPATTYSEYATTCVECTNKITISKGEEVEHGSYSLSKTGDVCLSNIQGGTYSVTVSATPDEHYYLATVTTSSGTAGEVVDNTCVVSGITATTTLTAVFEQDPQVTVTWHKGATTETTPNVYVGSTYSLLTPPDLVADDAAGDCANKFMGWATEPIDGSEGVDESDVVWATDDYVIDDTHKDIYAVFATKEGTGGDFTLVSGVSQLGEGEAYIGSYINYSGWSYYVATSSSDITKTTLSNNVLTPTAAMLKLTLVSTGTANQYYLKDANGKYLHASSQGANPTLSETACAWTFSGESSLMGMKSSLGSNVYLCAYSSGNTGKLKTYNSESGNTKICVYLSSATYSNYITTCSTDPSFNVSTAEITGLGYVFGSATSESTVKTFTVTGSNLSENVTVTAPTYFEMSLNGTTYGTNPIILTPSDVASAKTIYVRLSSGCTVNNYDGTITISSTEIAQNKTVTLSGSVTPAQLATPSVTATPGVHQITLSWDAVPNADSYQLVWNNGTPETVTSPVIKTGLTGGQSYSYSLVAVGTGNYSNSSAAAGNATAEKETYTVTWNIGANQETTANVEEGSLFSSLSAPVVADNAAGDCANKFMGWATASIEGSEGVEENQVSWVNNSSAISASNKDFYAVFATQEGSGGPASSLTLNFANNNYGIGNSWISTENTFTVGGISFNYVNSSVSNNVLNIGNAGYLYNTTSFVDIKSIAVTMTSGDFKYKTGNSAISGKQTDGTSASTTQTLTPLSGGYFNFSGGSSTAKISQIVINYSTATYSNYITQCGTYYDIKAIGVNETEWGTVSANKLEHIAENSTITISNNIFSVDGQTVTATPTTATAEYTYDFNGWTGITDGQSVTVDIESVTANFTRTLNQYTITYETDGGNWESAPTTTFDYNTVVDLPTNITKTNYLFDGWYQNEEKVTQLTMTDNQTVTARWLMLMTSFDVTSSNGSSFEAGATSQMNIANIQPDGVGEDQKVVTWSLTNVSPEGIASIDENGLVTTTGAGTFTVVATAVDGSATNSYNITTSNPNWKISVFNSSKNGEYNFIKGSGENEYIISDFVIPQYTGSNDSRQFWVGPGHYTDSNGGHSANEYFSWKRSYNQQANNCSANLTLGDPIGAIGTLHIWSNSQDANYGLCFEPNGYGIMWGKENSDWTSLAFSKTSATVWTTDVITLTQEKINSYKYYVGLLKDDGTYVGSFRNEGDAHGLSSTDNLSSMRHKTGTADDAWTDGLVAGKGRFRIWTDNCTQNFYCHFVPHYQLHIDNRGDVQDTYYSIEATNEERTITLPEPEYDECHHFEGWFTASDFTGTRYDAGDVITITGDVNLYAKWSANEYTIFYTYGAYTTLSGDHDQKEYGATFSLPTGSAVEGYNFLYWEYGDEHLSAGSSFTMPCEDVVLVAAYEIIQQTISYTVNGSAATQLAWTAQPATVNYWDNDLTAEYTIADGYHVSAAAVTVNDVALTTSEYAVDNDMIYIEPSAGKFAGAVSITLTIEPMVYTVYLSALDATNDYTKSVEATFGQEMPTITTLPERAGYTFLGYYDAQTGGTQYYLSTGASAHTWDISAGVTLIAQWSTVSYGITYTETTNLTWGDKPDNVNIETNMLTANYTVTAGYEVTGMTVTVGGNAIAAGDIDYTQTQVEIMTTFSGAVVITPIVTPKNYTLTFHKNVAGDDQTYTQPFYYGEVKTLTANTFTRTGYLFTGWAHTSGAGSASVLDGAEFTYDYTTNRSLYAMWEENPAEWFDVTFIDQMQDTEVANPEQYQHLLTGSQITFPTLDDKTPPDSGGGEVQCNIEHYHFVGWVLSTELDQLGTTATIHEGGSKASVTANATYYAIWATATIQ